MGGRDCIGKTPHRRLFVHSVRPLATTKVQRLIVFIGIAGCTFGAGHHAIEPEIHHTTTRFTSDGERILLERYQSSPLAPAVILLFGAGGLHSNAVPYKELVSRSLKEGYQVYIPHYLSLARSPASRRPAYRRYVQIVGDAVNVIEKKSMRGHAKIGLIGYSLGASVALAEASVNPSIALVISWNGSLPDEYVASAKLPPTLVIQGEQDTVIPAWNADQLMTLCQIQHFTCLLKLYPNEGHRFSSSSTFDVEDEILQFLAKYLPNRTGES